MVSVTALRPSKTTLGAAVEAFFADRDLAPATRRAYRATYDPLLETFGTDSPIKALTGTRLRRWITDRWGLAAPATWNVRITATRVLIGYCRRQGWLEGDPTARLLPRYLAGRRQGPVFVTAGLPNVVPAETDRSPDGRGRLSYQRAWSVFRKASGGRWTLHQLRHSALTHLGEDDVSAPLLMAKSRHRDLRTLSRYVRPGVEAVARLTAEHDPARRGKTPRR